MPETILLFWNYSHEIGDLLLCRYNIGAGLPLKQAGEMADHDCVFAAAYCTALAHGQDPGSFVYNQSIMKKKHLEQCLSNTKMTPKARRGGNSRYDEVDVYCLCRSIDDGSPMVCCDKCNEWFHLSCVKASNCRRQVVLPDLLSSQLNHCF